MTAINFSQRTTQRLIVKDENGKSEIMSTVLGYGFLLGVLSVISAEISEPNFSEGSEFLFLVIMGTFFTIGVLTGYLLTIVYEIAKSNPIKSVFSVYAYFVAIVVSISATLVTASVVADVGRERVFDCFATGAINGVLILSLAALTDRWRFREKPELELSEESSGSISFLEHDAVELLERLSDLFQRGILTEEEFNRKKAEILDSI
jgi:hypothetical protein